MFLERVANPERGCGQLQQGGCYAQGTTSESGTLNAWTWCLGEGLIGGANYNVTAPPRMMDFIRLPETLQMFKALKEEIDLVFPALRRLKRFALLDHVGENNYTPHQFAMECRAFGASRRIPEKIAAGIAKHTPIPIVFTHSQIPVVDADAPIGELLKLCGVPEIDIENRYYDPVHTNDDWGMTIRDWDGSSHWLTPLLAHFAANSSKHLTQILPPPLCDHVLFTEQIFGISWITRVVYVATGTETEDDLNKLLEQGIQPVQIEEEEQSGKD